jgi:hypothetical protein
MMSSMDEKHPGYSLKAPGRSDSGSAMRLPDRGPFPRVDDHLVEPEVTRDELIGGRRTISMPAKKPHATRQSVLDHLLQAHVAPGYVAATDLLTRQSLDSDFASDACVLKDGDDPATGTRYLEEMVFEVVSKQNVRKATEKALVMHRRGVRRIFAVFVKGEGRVCEWSGESRSWQPLDRASQIEDSCLVTPLPVAALLDAAAAAVAVVKGLAAQGNPELRRQKDEAKAEGVAESILKVLTARDIAVSEAQRQEILSCRDLDRLDRWLARAVLASSVEEVTAEP